MAIPVREGRGFTPEDRAGTPFVAVVNEALAARLRDTFGMHEPVGATVDLPVLGFGRDRRSTMTIVGIIGNERVRSDLREPNEPIAYVPIAQAPRMQIKLAVRTRGEAMSAMPSIREAVRQIDPRARARRHQDARADPERQPLGVASTGLGDRHLRDALGPARRARTLRRRRTYGESAAARNRHSHGARRRSANVLTMVVRMCCRRSRSDWPPAWAARHLTRVTKSLLFEVSPLDPFAFAIAAAAMAMVAIAAAVIPAGRATRLDPTTALRSE